MRIWKLALVTALLLTVGFAGMASAESVIPSFVDVKTFPEFDKPLTAAEMAHLGLAPKIWRDNPVQVVNRQRVSKIYKIDWLLPGRLVLVDEEGNPRYLVDCGNRIERLPSDWWANENTVPVPHNDGKEDDGALATIAKASSDSNRINIPWWALLLLLLLALIIGGALTAMGQQGLSSTPSGATTPPAPTPTPRPLQQPAPLQQAPPLQAARPAPIAAPIPVSTPPVATPAPWAIGRNWVTWERGVISHIRETEHPSGARTLEIRLSAAPTITSTPPTAS